MSAELWVNVRRTDGGQHDDIGMDDWGGTDPVALAMGALASHARDTGYPPGTYPCEVWTGRERSGRHLADFVLDVPPTPDRDARIGDELDRDDHPR